MSESDVSSSASRSGAVGKPPDPCWQFFDKVCEPNALGELIAQGNNNRLHRRCRGCSKVIKSCTVKAGEDHLLTCQKAVACFPAVKTVIQRSRAGKGDAKLPALLKRQHEQSTITSAAVPIPKAQEAASINAALLDMLVMCNVPFNAVDSAWFRRFCGTIRPGFTPLCKLDGFFAACHCLIHSSLIYFLQVLPPCAQLHWTTGMPRFALASRSYCRPSNSHYWQP